MTPRLASLCILLLALILPLAGCGAEKEAPPPTPVVEYRDRPTASVAGEVGVAEEVDAFGIMVFAQGTSFAAYTDEAGRYSITGLPAGEYSVRAMRPDLESAVIGAVAVTAGDLEKPQPFMVFPRVMMESRETDPAALAAAAMGQYGAIAGMVLTAPGDETSVVVALAGTAERTVPLINGAYRFPRIDPGDYDVLFSSTDYAQMTVPVTVVAGQVLDMGTVILRREGEAPTASRTIYGQVELLLADDNLGDDFGPVRVSIEGTSHSATPDATGKFEIQGLEPGIYTVGANAPGFLLYNKAVTDLRDLTAQEINLVLLEDTVTTGGRGVVEGRVLLLDPPDTGSGGISVSLMGSNYVAFTDASGNYQITGIEPGQYDLMASFNGYRSATVNGIAVAAEAPTQVPDITLEKEVEAPYVLATMPRDGERPVPIDNPTMLTIQFSERMDAASVRGALSIVPEVDMRIEAVSEGGSGAAVFDVALNAIPNPGALALKYGTTYRVTVARTATSLKGVPLREPHTFRFTTGEPMVIATYPENRSTDFAFRYAEPISIFFNAPINPETVAVDDIRFTPSLPASVNLRWRTDPDTGWSELRVQGQAEFGERYRVTLNRSARTVTGDRVRNLPYRFEFTTRPHRTYEEHYNLNPPTMDARERERLRQ